MLEKLDKNETKKKFLSRLGRSEMKKKNPLEVRKIRAFVSLLFQFLTY